LHAGCNPERHEPPFRAKQQHSQRPFGSEIGVGLAPLPAPLADVDDELMYLIGPMQELNYPVYLFTQPDLR
jgi:hypothetical protein